MTSPPMTEQTPETPQSPPPTPPWAWSVVRLFVVLIVVGIVFIVGRDLAQRLAADASPDPSESVLAIGTQIDVEIPPGAPANAIGSLLKEKGVIADADDFELAVRVSGRAAELKAGSYVLIAGSSDIAIIDALVRGPAPIPVYHVLVVEGLGIDATLRSLADQTEYTVAELSETLTSGEVFSAFLPSGELPEEVTDLQRWEGLLFPDTYEFAADAEAAEILQRLASTLGTRVDTVDWTAFEERGFTRYEGLVIASLIELEAKLDDDRPLISSVINNRLADGSLLQIDATVIYALGENRGRVLDADLEVESAYNTYLNAGLPPTPIGGVRLASIDAAANPAETTFFYYVVVDAEGRHGFSETLEEHNEKVATAREAGII